MPAFAHDRAGNCMSSTQNILVIRNDKLGDFMLAWPSFALLKQQYPQCKLTVLVPEYTRPIAEQCRWIDQIIIDKRHNSFLQDVKYLTALIKEKKFDVSISLFSEARTAIALWLAGVACRVAPATKLAQVFYTHRLSQRRSRSEKPESDYNLDLVRHYISTQGDKVVPTPGAPYLGYQANEIACIKNKYQAAHKIDHKILLAIIHPGSGGSAINLSSTQYAELAKLLNQKLAVHFIITAGPNELAPAEALAKQLTDISHSVYHSTSGLAEFSRFINIADIFISGSTGPLHIAGALNIPTAAFYPSRRSATALRWQTLNNEQLRLAFTVYQSEANGNIHNINLETCAKDITALLTNACQSTRSA